MTPTDEQTAEFKRLYKEHFGHDLTSAGARERGMSLLRVVKFIYQSVSQSEVDALEWHKNNKLSK